jgi:hypothetical protein
LPEHDYLPNADPPKVDLALLALAAQLTPFDYPSRLENLSIAPNPLFARERLATWVVSSRR